MSDEEFNIEEKRRKNVLDNQKFLQSLNLYNVRDDLKSSVNSVLKPQKKTTKRSKIDPSEIRRSSRIKTMNPQSIMYKDNYKNDDSDDFIVPTDESSSSEDENDLTAAFITKIDKEWEPKHPRPPRQAARPIGNGVKIFYPNTGLEASKILPQNNFHKSYKTKKMNVAISSSDDEN